MDHIVRYTTSSGEDKIEDVGSLDAAVSRVEALRNDEGVDNPRLYREVKVEFKTYVRAEVVDDGAGSGGGGAPATAMSAGGPPPAATPSASPSEPPPGAMPLSPQRPTTKVNEAIAEGAGEDDGGDSDDEGGGSRRTLFSRG